MTEWEALLRLAIAAVIGGMIGFERESLGQDAGLRTHMLVSMGAALFIVVSLLLVEHAAGAGRVADPTRVASTVVTGIGFLGAGVMFRHSSRVKGVTTAAGLWVAAGLGMAAGSGYFITAIGAAALALIILMVLRRFEVDVARNPRRRPDD